MASSAHKWMLLIGHRPCWVDVQGEKHLGKPIFALLEACSRILNLTDQSFFFGTTNVYTLNHLDKPIFALLEAYSRVLNLTGQSFFLLLINVYTYQVLFYYQYLHIQFYYLILKSEREFTYVFFTSENVQHVFLLPRTCAFVILKSKWILSFIFYFPKCSCVSHHLVQDLDSQPVLI